MGSGVLLLAAGGWAVIGRLAHILYFIVLPLLLLIALGYAVQRLLGLDMPTLTRLNFYLVIPALVFGSLLTSEVRLGQIGVVVGFGVAMILVVGVVTVLAAWLRGVPRRRWNALLMTTVFYNSGNYGLPLQDLAFRGVGASSVAVSIQVFTMLVQNFANFTLGVFLAAGGRKRGAWKENLAHIARFPPLYALAAGLIAIQFRHLLGGAAPQAAAALRPLWEVVLYLQSAFVAVALCTLGAQLALVHPLGDNDPLALSILLRLLAAPLIALGIILALGIHGLVAQVLLIGSATPSPVNAALLSLEFGNEPEYVARAVLYTTVLSPLTVTLVISVAQGGLIPG